jgi:hypothetical protein
MLLNSSATPNTSCNTVLNRKYTIFNGRWTVFLNGGSPCKLLSPSRVCSDSIRVSHDQRTGRRISSEPRELIESGAEIRSIGIVGKSHILIDQDCESDWISLINSQVYSSIFDTLGCELNDFRIINGAGGNRMNFISLILLNVSVSVRNLN